MNQTPPTLAEKLDARMVSLGTDLNEHGIGDVSVMCRERVIETMLRDLRLPEVHANEGKKFSDMAYRIAHPDLVAEYVEAACTFCPRSSHSEHRMLTKRFPK